MAVEYTTIGELDPVVLPFDDDNDLLEVEQPAQSPAGRKCAISDIIYHPVLTVRDRGYVSGFDIYKVGNQEICIRPGVRYYTNGTLEYVIEKTDFQSIGAGVINALTASKWYGVFLAYDGTVAIDATPLTGAATARPSDNFYGWVDGDNTKYRHDRQGYYNGDYLCIGCIYLDGSKYVTYIINQLSGSDEIGENSRGSWSKSSNVMNQVGETALLTGANAGETVTFPVPFISEPVSVQAAVERVTDIANVVYCYTQNKSSTQIILYMQQASATQDNTISYKATGPWHL